MCSFIQFSWQTSDVWTNSTLTISVRENTPAGEYQCRARNAIAMTTMFLHLGVKQGKKLHHIWPALCENLPSVLHNFFSRKSFLS